MKLIKKFFKHALVIAILGYPVLHIFKSAKVLNPLKRELADFKFTDIYFGRIQNSELDTNIYLIDIGMKDKVTTRSEITDFINTINKKYKPKVIAIDVDFKYDASVHDSINSKLIKSISNDNIVISYSLDKENLRKQRSHLHIDYNAVSEGFTNNLIKPLNKINESELNYGVQRFFKPCIISSNDTLKHFSVVTAEKYSDNFDKSLLQDNNKVMINFQYEYHDPICIEDTISYHKLKDKIVIIGIFTKNKSGNPLYHDDVHYTSSNKFYLGKSPPNMYGGEIIATIISNINKNSFVKYHKSFSFWINIILSIVIYLNLLYFMGKSHNIFGAAGIITQFGIVSSLIFLSVFFVAKFNIYLDLTIAGIIAFFLVEFISPVEVIQKFGSSKIKITLDKLRGYQKRK